ncbi:MAG: di-heme enzyme [Alphaproteobacteria bacterium]|nr:di-heme enzyme [Alphaproteobacteria bacterium]MCB9795142.1 di-heme enzyme [Alphaproteobacteria bacterium]
MWSLLLLACGPELDPQGWDWELPPNFPVPEVPEDNPMTRAKVELGRHLFYEPMLSENETQSCGSCHLQELAWTEGLGQALGSTGETHPRGAMSLVGVGYASTLTWANPVLRTLEDQALVPLFGEHPVEMGMSGQEALLLERLSEDALYQGLFEDAYPEEPEPITLSHVTGAIASFERSIISHDSPYDQLRYKGEWDALSESALRGMDLFFGERLECFHCHGGFNLSDSTAHEGTVFDERPFHNTGLYNLDGTGAYPPDNMGLYEITGVETDMGRFRAPSLRNIALTAPYFHDGSAATLDEVLDHYAAGGRTIEEGPYAGVGSENPYKSAFVSGFLLTEAEREDLKAFLESLTDEGLLSDPRYADPFAE